MKYKAIFFDFDYTLADASDGIIVGIKGACQKLGLPYQGDEMVRRGMGGTLQQIYDLAVGVPLTEEQFEAFRHKYVADSEAVLTDLTWFFDDIEESFKIFKSLGMDICIVTNKKTTVTMEPLVRDGLDKYITYVMGRDRMPAPKPDGRGAQNLCAQLGLSTDEAIFCGDSLYDADTAKNAGMPFCPVTTGKTTRAQFEPYEPLFIADHMLELAHFLQNLAENAE